MHCNSAEDAYSNLNKVLRNRNIVSNEEKNANLLCNINIAVNAGPFDHRIIEKVI